jgi:hypothetical protein
MVDIAAGLGRLVDRRFKPRFQRLVILAPGGGGQIQFAKQVRVGLREADDHVDQFLGAFGLQMVADARERTAAVPVGRVGRQRRRHHVLAEARVLEGQARTFAAELVAAPVISTL